MKHYKNLLVPGNVLDNTKTKQCPTPPDKPFTVFFDDGHEMNISVDVHGILVTLWRGGSEKDRQEIKAFDLEGDFKLYCGDDAYQMTIARGAKSELTQADIDKYVKTHSNLCPFCQSGDIHGGRVEIDAAGAHQNITCCACEAEWSDTYKLETIDGWTPPKENILCANPA